MQWRSARCWVPAAVAGVVLAVTVVGLTGCGRNGGPADAGPATLGSPPEGDVDTVCSGCLTEENVGKTVAIEGEIVQQCPASGCWFRMKDDGGEVFVDLAPAKLRLTEKREGQHAKVTGRVMKRGGRFRLEARYVELTPAKKDAPSSQK